MNRKLLFSLLAAVAGVSWLFGAQSVAQEQVPPPEGNRPEKTKIASTATKPNVDVQVIEVAGPRDRARGRGHRRRWGRKWTAEEIAAWKRWQKTGKYPGWRREKDGRWVKVTKSNRDGVVSSERCPFVTGRGRLAPAEPMTPRPARCCGKPNCCPRAKARCSKWGKWRGRKMRCDMGKWRGRCGKGMKKLRMAEKLLNSRRAAELMAMKRIAELAGKVAISNMKSDVMARKAVLKTSQDTLTKLYMSSSDPVVKRAAIFTSSKIYEKFNQPAKAIEVLGLLGGVKEQSAARCEEKARCRREHRGYHAHHRHHRHHRRGNWRRWHRGMSRGRCPMRGIDRGRCPMGGMREKYGRYHGWRRWARWCNVSRWRCREGYRWGNWRRWSRRRWRGRGRSKNVYVYCPVYITGNKFKMGGSDWGNWRKWCGMSRGRCPMRGMRKWRGMRENKFPMRGMRPPPYDEA